MLLTKEQAVGLLLDTDKKTVAGLFRQADATRRKYVGDQVHLRGLIEFSNYCRKDCLYCGLRKSNRKLRRYRMGLGEIFAAAQNAAGLGLRTIVLQSGEDPQYKSKELCLLIEKIKKLDAAVTLSVGELTFSQYKQLKSAGADRYLLKFETSDPQLYKKLRPGCVFSDRLRCLNQLKELGYQVGSGIMTGLPGQTIGSIADDIFIFKDLELDMIGIGPFIPHPNTPLAKSQGASLEQVLRAVALTRIVTKYTHIPATTATGTIDSRGRQKALQCGANILMPNATPLKYRKLYKIYPDKICLSDDAFKCRGCVKKMVLSLGRKIGSGPGHSLRKR
ncbi:MAG: [FeFe] hydrogenase H-cluster radical SAM maturase HydE [Candidatus Omnitrophica bacterium]|jgi:biotin synthase|nr:[FeFe] hydrogenase H-cluster radical SAM maturase HydE [Candidatus Omnitrophota bacterium]MDD5079306.1 [FeFe] hydrogenase H-cluster radical SAM maturase HydE [Candidatus Omnitrophota bacterium]